MIGRPPSFRAEVREIDLIACEMTYIMRLISVTRERDEIKAHSTAFGYLFERRGCASRLDC